MAEELTTLRIDIPTHDILKKYCKKHGLIMYRFVADLVAEKLKESDEEYENSRDTLGKTT